MKALEGFKLLVDLVDVMRLLIEVGKNRHKIWNHCRNTVVNSASSFAGFCLHVHSWWIKHPTLSPRAVGQLDRAFGLCFALAGILSLASSLGLLTLASLTGYPAALWRFVELGFAQSGVLIVTGWWTFSESHKFRVLIWKPY
ncbi:MAG TPA: hypothetical protein VKX25_13110 [Bryobacteraceae bacterium]|jgi:hypothetical protein|nr:hypothetical protein [Bryobacteraceae bacterium]